MGYLLAMGHNTRAQQVPRYTVCVCFESHVLVPELLTGPALVSRRKEPLNTGPLFALVAL